MASSIVDEDTRQSMASGRETIGAALSTVQTHLRKVFIVFVIGFLGTFYALRLYVWDELRAITVSQMDPEVAERMEIIVQTPFEVILLQAKIGIIIGIIISIPFLVYFSRGELRARGWWPQTPIPLWKIAILGTISISLGIGGIVYAYELFFPFMFDFVATHALGVGVEPHWSIVMWTEFLILLTLSFALAAQLPLVMSALAYANIVQYETFRDNWKYAIIGIFVFGAFFSPPDPFTLFMWAAPLVLLYAASLGLTKLVVKARRDPPREYGAPEDIDLTELDASGVKAAPPEAFEEMSEDEMLAVASAAIDDDDREKAQAVIDRYDAVHEADEEGDESETGETSDDGTQGEPAGAGDAEEEEGLAQRTATGVVNAITDEETDEDDIGGYFYDIRFVFDSLRSKSFYLVGWFMLVLAAVFTFLYQGGLRWVKDDFLTRIPAEIRPEDVSVIALHPIEVLIFIVKVSTLAAVIATLPALLYYAWPALLKRNLASGQRKVVYEWTTAMTFALVGGTIIGYLWIAPSIMAFLVQDAIRAEMIISYQINKFSWLIIFTTAGVGLLACVPVTMWMLYRGGIASYRGMRNRWREVTIAVFALAGIFTPVSVLTMFLVGIPVMIAYWIGLIVLWIVTLGGRRDHGGGTSRFDPATFD